MCERARDAGACVLCACARDEVLLLMKSLIAGVGACGHAASIDLGFYLGFYIRWFPGFSRSFVSVMRQSLFF